MNNTNENAVGDTIESLRLKLDTSTRWNAMSQRITTALLEDTDEEDALRLICHSVLEVAEADTALIVLPSLGGKYISEITAGEAQEAMLGLEFPPEGRAQSVIRSNVGMIVPSMERAQSLRVPALSRFGPALYAPMSAHKVATGVIILFRNPGRSEFTTPDLKAAEDLAAQATLALRLSAIRHAEDRANLLEERQRIARDLHDLVIQQLFAASLQLNGLKEDLDAKNTATHDVTKTLDQALVALADSVEQIRLIVSGLKETDVPERNLVEGLRHEASLARRSLGFAPSVVLKVDDEVFGKDNAERLESCLSDLVDETEIADVLAVMREGLMNVARHAHATEVLVEANVCTKGNSRPPDCTPLVAARAPLRSESTGFLSIEIVDDGVGLGEIVGRHSGLANMAARASVHFGHMSMENRFDAPGAKLSWCIPLGA